MLTNRQLLLFTPAWTFPGATLDLDFVRNRGYAAGQGSGPVGKFLTVTRASDGYCENESGVLEYFSPAGLRRTNKGARVEESRTNSIRNNSMQGAAVGDPGTLPTNWVAGDPQNGLAREIVGIGTVDGVDYIDIRYFGTTSTTARIVFDFDAVNQIAASAAQVWTGSAFLRLTINSGATPEARLAIFATDSGSVEISRGESVLSGLSSWRRHTQTYTMPGSTVYTFLRLGLVPAASTAYDFTLRIGWPQLELGAFTTSPIRTTSAAAARATDTVTEALTGTSEGSLVIHAKTAPGAVSGTNQALFQWDDGTADNRIFVYRDAANNNVLCSVVTGGVTQALINLGAVAHDTNFKVGFSWEVNDFVAVLNGGSPGTDTSATVPTGLTTIRHGRTTFGLFWGGLIQRTAVFPTWQSGAQLQALTS